MTDRPWESEPDHEDFTSSGLDCALCRGPLGAWCGYVRVDESHPLFEADHMSESEALGELLEQRKEQPIGDTPGFGVLIAALSGEIKASPEIVFQVHGGLTYSNKTAGGGTGRKGWWFGFDCSHAGDLLPQSGFAFASDGIYRTIDYVRSETEKLAKQLGAML